MEQSIQGPSSCSKIFQWLSDLPNPPSHQDPPQQSQPGKRRRPSSLSETTANMQTPPRKKVATSASGDKPAGDLLDVNAAIADEMPTPKPVQAQSSIAPASLLPGPSPFTAAAAASGPTDSNQSSYTTSTTSDRSRLGTGKRKREISPTKKLAALQISRHGVVNKSFRLGLDELPPSSRSLINRMTEIAHGIGIIPPEREADLLQAAKDACIPEDRIVSSERAHDGGLPTLDDIYEIVEYTEFNTRQKASEAAWNCNVHAPLLQYALRYSPHKKSVCWHNITTASIRPPHLLPILTKQQRTSSKKADFAISLTFNDDISERLYEAGIESISQSDYVPLWYSPAAVSIETKLPAEGGSEADLQLNTWGLAQINLLKELLQKVGTPDGDIPPLPLIVVHGAQWYFRCMQATTGKAIVWGKVLVGDTDSVRGVLQILAAIQHWMHWAHNVYRPWLEETVLTPLLKVVA